MPTGSPSPASLRPDCGISIAPSGGSIAASRFVPAGPWPCIERSSCYELADRLDDALAAARRSLELHPWFRPGVQSTAHILLRLSRDREALDLLTEANERLESGLIAAQLAAVQNDLGHHADARKTLDRYADLSPMMEPETQKWLAARWADTAYFLGEPAAAVEHAKAVRDDFYDSFAKCLEESSQSHESNVNGASSGQLKSPRTYSSTPRRRVLPFDPSATTVYEILTRYWKYPLANPPSDAPPPVDGLPDAAERDRAERAGWVAREFTLSLNAAEELIGRGLPFIVSLVEAGFTRRLCVGVDAVRGTVFLVDGTERRPIEAPTQSLLGRFAAFGPRCLVLVPTEHAAKLTSTAWVDQNIREALYAVQRPLLTHDRAAAVAAFDRMRGVPFSPAHALRGIGTRPIRCSPKQAARLLRRSPGRASARGDLRPFKGCGAARIEPDDRADRATRGAKGQRSNAEPLVSQSLAQVLLPNPRRQEEASWLLRAAPCGIDHWLPRDITCLPRSGGKIAASWMRPKSTDLLVRLTTAKISSRKRISEPRGQPSKCRKHCVCSSRRPVVPRSISGRDTRSLPCTDGPRRTGTSVGRDRSGDQETCRTSVNHW